MKTLLKKTTRMMLAVAIPVLFMAGCESDFIEPQNAMPPKDKVNQLPPGVNKD